jgi:type II secretory pathway pseudopilin PulG
MFILEFLVILIRREINMKLLKKWFKKLQTNMGYTLVEVTAVVAITATLGAVVVPIAIDKTTEGKLAAARADSQSIGNAITSFFTDVGYMPGDPSTGVAGTGTVYFSGSSGNVAVPPRTTAVSNWPSVVATTLATTITVNGVTGIDFLDNHLVNDNPFSQAATAGYVSKNLNWKGPYSESFNKRDPWGNSYLVYVAAMYGGTTGASKTYGWIVSAGPNGQLETETRSSKLVGDDIGYALFAADSGKQ